MEETSNEEPRRAEPTAAGDTRSTSESLSSEARGLAAEASREARGMVEQQVKQQQGAVADSLSSVARALESTARQLESEDQTGVAGYASSIASSIDRFSSSIRDRDLDSLRRDAEGFAKARPALFLGGCVALGFALSRFLKAGGATTGTATTSPARVGGLASQPSPPEPASRTDTSPRFSSIGEEPWGGMAPTYFPEEKNR